MANEKAYTPPPTEEQQKIIDQCKNLFNKKDITVSELQTYNDLFNKLKEEGLANYILDGVI